jgi:hypothetical protein
LALQEGLMVSMKEKLYLAQELGQGGRQWPAVVTTASRGSLCVSSAVSVLIRGLLLEVSLG